MVSQLVVHLLGEQREYRSHGVTCVRSRQSVTVRPLPPRALAGATIQEGRTYATDSDQLTQRRRRFRSCSEDESVSFSAAVLRLIPKDVPVGKICKNCDVENEKRRHNHLETNQFPPTSQWRTTARTHKDSHHHTNPRYRRKRRPRVDEHPGGQEYRRETCAEKPCLRTFLRVVFTSGDELQCVVPQIRMRKAYA